MADEITIRTRDELIALLSEASELEHGLACSYLFAAFSLKRSVDEGLTEEQAEAVRRWERVISEIAVQEMLHLSLASNLLTAIGAAPQFWRPNFPQLSSYYPPAFKLALTPFNEETLQHFIFLERPEGVEAEDAPSLAEDGETRSVEEEKENEIGPDQEDYRTVGHLYRSIEEGFRSLVERYGERGVFVGPPRAQATEAYFSFPELAPVTDLASARAAIETIVEQGEGNRGRSPDAHYARFRRIEEEYQALKQASPDFEPARPVLTNPFGRVPTDTADVNVLDDPVAIEVSDLFNGCYEVMVQMLNRFFAHTDETDDELRTLVDASIGAMTAVVKPLGDLLTTLPAGPRYPGMTAGPSFEFYRTIRLLPHKRAAWLLFHERLTELAGYCGQLAGREGAARGLTDVECSLRDLAASLEKHLV